MHYLLIYLQFFHQQVDIEMYDVDFVKPLL